MSFHRTRGEVLTYDYCLNGLSLDLVNQVKDFGILYILSVDFCLHIDYTIINNSLHVLGFIRPILKNFIRLIVCLI